MRIILGHTIALQLLFGAQAVLLAQAHIDFWDRAPILYSDTPATDRLAKLAANLESGAVHYEGAGGLDRLHFVLKALDVPPESQVLVFSKTSLQNPLIEPGNPRALFFSENAYVGYVPGGAIEVIAQDPVIGPVFYVVEAGAKGEPRIERDTNQCMTCHATSRTENVPGLMIRSVFADKGRTPTAASRHHGHRPHLSPRTTLGRLACHRPQRAAAPRQPYVRGGKRPFPSVRRQGRPERCVRRCEVSAPHQ